VVITFVKLEKKMATAKHEKRDKHFGEWFRQMLMDAEILDYRYPIKG
jgi:hypothetical protein